MMLTVVITSATGLGVFAAALVLLISSLRFNRAENFRVNVPQQEARKARKEVVERASDKRIVPAMVGGAVFGAALAFGSPVLLPAVLFGAVAGLLLVKLFDRFKNSSREFELTREVALLYESVDLFMRAGFTVRQALQMSIVLVPSLQHHVNNCLDRWPSGPLRALEHLGEDIGVKQADMLVGLLMQAVEGGLEKVVGIMEQEAVRLEELRQGLAEGRIAQKPIYSAVYLFLPVASVMGIIIAPLAYRAIQMITGLQAGGM